MLADAAGEDEGVEAAERRPPSRAIAGRAGGAGRRRARARASARRARPPRAPRACRPCRPAPSSPDSCSSASRELAPRPRRCARAATAASPGSTLPDRVAITSPSSGVKPIVVSTRAAVAHGGQRRARAEVAGDDAPRARDELRGPPRRVGVRQAVEAVAPQRASARATRPAARRSRPPPAAWRGTPCRSTRPPAVRAARARTASSAASDLRLVQRRERGQRAQRGRDRVVDRPPARGTRSPPCTTRWPTASAAPSAVERRRVERRPRAASRSRVPSSSSPAPSSRSLRLLDPALTTRTRTGSAARQHPVADLGRVVAVLARVARARAGARRPSPGAARGRALPSPGTRSMTSMTRWKRSRSLSITMSNGVVVGALLLVAAHVQVVGGSSRR